jgi:hypothetical protein
MLIKPVLRLSQIILFICLSLATTMAQNDQGAAPRQGGRRQRQRNFDPAQFQQRMMERYRERLEVTDDAEWKAMEPLIQNVLQARVSLASGRGTFGRGRGRPNAESGASTTPATNPLQTNPAADELRKAIDTKAAKPELKAALSKYLDYRKNRQAELDKARDALRAVLTSRQEAIAVLSGLL